MSPSISGRRPLLGREVEHLPDDGLAPSLVETDHPRTLDGGAAERMTETTGHRVLAMVEA